ncbi:DUF262 domain-containing protein [Xylanibacter ruminicola]|uniref:Uncharacterized conserved protein, contains ParB-like and HNH nuclease domains n=1 Tax=Xylanibacter ruminicola TaxID=839 RepID=A0A1M6VEL3_XYLRU|nr:DUF262 domain-containing protein [Xylanibacter ruminicola]SHK79987.1 Uncharacterized conserved protein, contains ParB-like and HNH nuclease domains [Xylanibacter ruminicola]
MKAPKEYTIQELLGKISEEKIQFKIPGYQRGYKWTKTQADQLIDDLISYGTQQKLIGSDYSYQAQNQKSASAYYLQPISVCPTAEDGNVYDVIDGQQRLTTIWLLLYACHKNKNKIDNIECPQFSLEYESFASWQDEFNGIENDDFDAFKCKSLNHFHIHEVFSTFIKRVGNLQKGNKNNKVKAKTIYQILLYNTKIIWSDISSDGTTNQDSIRTFTNLNSGKIPLTCGELIKGLVLQENKFRKIQGSTNDTVKDEDQRLLLAIQDLIKKSRESKALYDKIAHEWDEFERELHDEKLWQFIYNKEANYIYDTRLEYIFNLIEKTDKGDDSMHSFYKLYDRVTENPVEEIKLFWDNVEKYMATIREWYKDKEYYHLIGYLVATTPWISVNDDKQKNKIIDKTVISYLINGLYGDNGDKWSKSTLRDKIKKLIIKSLINVKEDSPESDDGQLDPDILDNLRYNQDNDAICRYLLFFNIHTILMQEGEERFPFNRYKEERWDIEHIASQTDFNSLKKDSNEAKLWALHIIQYFTGLKVDNYIEEGRISKGKNTFIGKKVRELPENDLNKLQEYINNSFQDSDSDKKKLCQSLKEYLCGNSDMLSIQQQLKDLGLGATMPDEEKDKIGNLTLLNMSINRGYGNAIFPVKRMTIQDELQKGYFVPPCTQRVFQKAYSRKFDQLYVWNEQDAEAYLESMKEAINTFNEIKGTYAEYKLTKINS